MPTLVKQIISGIFLGLVSLAPVGADEPLDLVVGGRLLFSTWEANNNDGSKFDAENNQFGLNITLHKNRWYGGLNLQSGEYEFRSGAPDLVDANSSISDTSANIERGEADIFIGYYFWDHVSLFLDIKSVTNNWKDFDYSLNYSGLGTGVTVFYPLNDNWTLYGSLGFVPLTIEADSNEIGDGEGSALEVGALFSISQFSNLTLSLKNQHQEYNFDNGDEQSHDIGGLMVGYNYRFEL